MVSTHLKNISQLGSFPQIGVKIKDIGNHHPVLIQRIQTPYTNSCSMNWGHWGFFRRTRYFRKSIETFKLGYWRMKHIGSHRTCKTNLLNMSNGKCSTAPCQLLICWDHFVETRAVSGLFLITKHQPNIIYLNLPKGGKWVSIHHLLRI